jgi:hypothetical protein
MNSKNFARTALTVKVGRYYPDKVKVRACLPVIWVIRGQAKMREYGIFCLALLFFIFLFNQPL